MFDLEKAIATWRASLTWKRSIDKQDRDELERHIRDAVERDMESGLSEEDAFRKAIRQMGQLPQIDREYRKIYWGKLRKRRRLGDELAWRAAMLKNYFTIALRLLIKQRIYAVINIFGLAVGIAFCLLLLVTLLSGFYPAMVLSRYRPTDMLRKQSRLGGSSRLTSTLVMLQFTLSVALIAGTFIMGQQMSYMQTVNIGYDRDHVVLVNAQNQVGPRLLQHFQTSLDGRSEFEGITAMTNAFSHGWSSNGWQYKGEQKSAFVYRVEANFQDVMDIELVEGRFFDPLRGTDSTMAVVVNEAFVADFGMEEPIGTIVDGFSQDPPEIIGVVKDFNFLSLHETVSPMMFVLYPWYEVGDILFQVKPERVPEALALIEETWSAFAPDVPFIYSFLDDDLNAQYESEARWTQIVRYASLFAILIAALGLFGLASLTVSSRTKEIGVRRVLGASTMSIASMLSRGFVRLVLAGIVLSIPITWIGASKWLDSFAYRIDISLVVFVIAATVALGIALATVSFQTVRAANMNPVDSIRVE